MFYPSPLFFFLYYWQYVPQQQMEEFHQLSDLMKTDKNFANYRETLAAVDYQKPCMPYLGKENESPKYMEILICLHRFIFNRFDVH